MLAKKQQTDLASVIKSKKNHQSKKITLGMIKFSNYLVM